MNDHLKIMNTILYLLQSCDVVRSRDELRFVIREPTSGGADSRLYITAGSSELGLVYLLALPFTSTSLHRAKASGFAAR